MPCGSGRHAELLVDQGFTTVVADIDPSCLRLAVQVLQAEARGSLCAVQLDASLPLPFREGVFDLVVVVHAPYLSILLNAAPTVRSGGYLVFETFGAQGENWRALPRRRQVAEQLSTDFEALVYREGAVSRAPETATVKALFRRR